MATPPSRPRNRSADGAGHREDVTDRRWPLPDPETRPAEPLSRTQRRALRTRAGLKEAFVALAREKGYDKVSVEDIVDRADVARATFYAHYASKDAVLSAVFSDLIEELMDRIGVREGPWEQARPDAIRASYQHAAEMPDLYEVCLSDPRAREAYLTRLTSQVEQNFWMRLKAMGREPRLPVFIMARGFAGALLAVLESWLAGDIDQPADELAAIVLDLLVAGTAWGHNISLEELGYSTKPNPKPSKGKTAKNGGSTRKSPRPTRERLPVKAVPRTSGRTDRSVE